MWHIKRTAPQRISKNAARCLPIRSLRRHQNLRRRLDIQGESACSRLDSQRFVLRTVASHRL